MASGEEVQNIFSKFEDILKDEEFDLMDAPGLSKLGDLKPPAKTIKKASEPVKVTPTKKKAKGKDEEPEEEEL